MLDGQALTKLHLYTVSRIALHIASLVVGNLDLVFVKFHLIKINSVKIMGPTSCEMKWITDIACNYAIIMRNYASMELLSLRNISARSKIELRSNKWLRNQHGSKYTSLKLNLTISLIF